MQKADSKLMRLVISSFVAAFDLFIGGLTPARRLRGMQ
jgi:hypothetical protein